MHRMSRLAAATGLTLATCAGIGSITQAATAAGAEAPPTPTPTPVSGWPGSRHNPAGLHSWTEGAEGRQGWMHSGKVEITFDTIEDDWSIPVGDIGRAGADIEGPYPDGPARVTDVRLQAWLLDVDDTRVVVIVKSFPDTAPGLVAEAEAIVASIRVEPAANAVGYRLVFALPEGWDSG